MPQILATLTPSPVRRTLGALVMAALGALLIWMALATAPSLIWRIALLILGGLALAGMVGLWQATRARIELTETELRDTAGNRLALIDDILAIDRGAFAFKPSNGFVLKLSRPHPRGWAPGLWWRTGQRVGVGGVTGASEGKAMAEALAARIAARSPVV
ncbi:hypothetical protein [Oceaniglobus trochenteri]|uniref:hypothetical protein n=1 Tax=Oceaniglobus trochenteri TaxID=2763260 RepID=UPI001CFFE5AC|nr:hypothetical protein [Oceaniglobus trochenteri]